MSWIILVAAGLFEVVCADGVCELGAIDGTKFLAVWIPRSWVNSVMGGSSGFSGIFRFDVRETSIGA